MKVLQLIDSLDPGGAEKMAVTLANSLLNEVEESHLCVTRKEGLLKDMLEDSVHYLFLKKSGSLDLAGLNRLRNYVRKNKIDVIHAHSSSFFWATLVKISYRSVRIVWHDHYGKSEQLAERKYGTLRKCSGRFHAIISVNEKLRQWAVDKLKCEKVVYLKNFVAPDLSETDLQLEGEQALRIVCLANLRRQKDHLNLLEAFGSVKESFPNATLHCIGKVVDVAYSEEIKNYIAQNSLTGVYLHGAQRGIDKLLNQASVGVLSSASEGLPLALLEYGLAGLPVVCTDVGQCAEVLKNNGLLVAPGDAQGLAAAINTYLSNSDKANQDATHFSEHITINYSFKAILPLLMDLYKG